MEAWERVWGRLDEDRTNGESTLKAWAGKEENWKKAHDALLTRCKANSEAVLGKYKGDATPAEGASESLHVKDYKY
ncbi:unnamed protein product [Linum trigynum]|uniref:fructose-bisphosphate aldolase n=1 Tax=Linum trigynum TaxID=586398 RepID=A0AAV2FXI0_9ROSI